MPPGSLRVLHTQLLVRGGARTPLRPSQPESFWKGCLPSEAQVQKIRREGGAGALGARRSRLPLAAEERLRDSEVWGQLTTRGADEARAVGARLERWLAQRDVEGPPAEEDDDEDSDDDGQGPPRRRRSTWRGIAATALATPDLRAELTARATLSGLALPPDVRVGVDAMAGARLQVGHRLEGVLGGAAEVEAWLEGANLGLSARHDAALDLLELLGLGSEAAPLLEGAGWPELLDIAESSSLFGLLPNGGLAKTTRRRLFRAPRLAAQALVDASWSSSSSSSSSPPSGGADGAGTAGTGTSGGGGGGTPLAPLLQTLLAPSLRAARGLSRERLRITVLPGFSMLCWASALGLDSAAKWPAPSTCFLVETLADDKNDAFVRVWHLRDLWELRPAWHRGDGPVPLPRLLEHLAPVLGKGPRSSPGGAPTATDDGEAPEPAPAPWSTWSAAEA